MSFVKAKRNIIVCACRTKGESTADSDLYQNDSNKGLLHCYAPRNDVWLSYAGGLQFVCNVVIFAILLQAAL